MIFPEKGAERVRLTSLRHILAELQKKINVPPLLKLNIQDNTRNTNDNAVVLTLSKTAQEKLEEPKYAAGNQEIEWIILMITKIASSRKK